MARTLFKFLFLGLVAFQSSTAQTVLQTVRGTVFDLDTRVPLAGATIVVLDTDPLVGATSDREGVFRIPGVPTGRYNIRVSFVGYESFVQREVLVGSGKEVVLRIGLTESTEILTEIVVNPGDNKAVATDPMASVSSRRLNIEEARRYAGAMDDPALLVTSFAGVAGSFSHNGIVVRGNSPQSIGWRLEGVEIPTPSHFADVTVFGGGGISALSRHVLSDSDFFTGAFPASYGNALSGVFDIRLREGNTERREYTSQIGLLGIDIATEGPISTKNRSSYLLNYRYSTFALFAPLLPEDAGGIRYQDGSFKITLPSMKNGRFTIWGLGAKNRGGTKAENDPALRLYDQDREDSEINQWLGVAGIGHVLLIDDRSVMETTLGIAGSGLAWSVDRSGDNGPPLPYQNIQADEWDVSLSASLLHKFHSRHTIRTGVTAKRRTSRLDFRRTVSELSVLQTFIDSRSESYRVDGYVQSRFLLTDNVRFIAGAHTLYYDLLHETTFEPRISVEVNLGKGSSIRAGYGNHSRIERSALYDAPVPGAEPGTFPNRELKLARAHHFVLGLDVPLMTDLRLRLEPYYQMLYYIPVVRGTSESILNLEQDWFFDKQLVSEGTGENMGLDLTLEKYHSGGVYYLASGSVFRSRYRGGDGIERPTRYDRGVVFNLLGGKEFVLSTNRILSVNARVNYLRGNRYTPLDEDETLRDFMVHYDETRSFTLREPDIWATHLALSLRNNRSRFASEWSIQVINVLGEKQFNGFRYNYLEGTIDRFEETTVIPNLLYKIEW